MHSLLGLADPDGTNMYTTTSITSPGRPTLYNAKKLPKPFEIKVINRIDDIPGTVAVHKFAKFATRPQFNAATDLPESVPKVHSKTRNVVDRQLMISDIDGAQYSAIGGMERTNRMVDPLQPEYSLPSFKAPMELFEAKSLSPPRNIMNIHDIDGTQSNMFRRTGNRATRDPLLTDDIDGARADYNGFKSVRGRFEVALNTSKNFMDEIAPVGLTHAHYKPLTFESSLKFAERTTRRSNPVQPVYEVNGIIIQDNDTTKPKKAKHFIEQGTFSLTTQDIVGATSANSPKKRERTGVRDIMITSDVPGAQADTVVHSIVSDRDTCPLFPVYQSLDDGSPLQPVVKPLLEKSQMNHPSLRLLQRQRELSEQLLASTLSNRSGSNTPKGLSLNNSASGELLPSPYYSPINSSRSRGSNNGNNANTNNSNSNQGQLYTATGSGSAEARGGWGGHSMPQLNTNFALDSARSGGRSGRSQPRSERETSAQISRRAEIDAVRSLQ